MRSLPLHLLWVLVGPTKIKDMKHQLRFLQCYLGECKVLTRYNPRIPSFLKVCVRQSIGPLNLAVSSRTWDCKRTLVRSKGCSKTFETIPAICWGNSRFA